MRLAFSKSTPFSESLHTLHIQALNSYIYIKSIHYLPKKKTRIVDHLLTKMSRPTLNALNNTDDYLNQFKNLDEHHLGYLNGTSFS